jgi:hypothetical protein
MAKQTEMIIKRCDDCPCCDRNYNETAFKDRKCQITKGGIYESVMGVAEWCPLKKRKTGLRLMVEE